jgi:hypothetical protein
LYKNNTFYINNNKYSSIKYKNIRFLNDYRCNSSWYSIIDPYKSNFTIDNYSLNNNPNNHNNTIHKYRLSRKFRNVFNLINYKPYDFEKLYIRYNYQPFYMSFDMVTIILSMLNKKIVNSIPYYNIEFDKTDIRKFLMKYVDEYSLSNILNIFYNHIEVNDIDVLLELLIKNSHILFIQQYS